MNIAKESSKSLNNIENVSEPHNINGNIWWSFTDSQLNFAVKFCWIFPIISIYVQNSDFQRNWKKMCINNNLVNLCAGQLFNNCFNFRFFVTARRKNWYGSNFQKHFPFSEINFQTYYPAKSGILQSPSCVCLFVCLFLSRISHKRLVEFWWNLVSREVMIIGRPSSKLGVIRIEIRIWDPDNCFSWTTGRIFRSRFQSDPG